jgi:hypothetical protein
MLDHMILTVSNVERSLARWCGRGRRVTAAPMPINPRNVRNQTLSDCSTNAARAASVVKAI